MKQHYKIKPTVLKYLLLLVALSMAATNPVFGQVSGNKGQGSNLSNGQNKGNRLSKELEESANNSSVDSNDMVDVIIQFRNVPGEAEDAAVNNEGGSRKAKLHLINGNLYHVPVKALKRLANNPSVFYISPDRTAEQFADYSLATIGADLVQSYGYDGTGVGVAIVDSGVMSHPDLNDKFGIHSRIVYSESFVAGLDASDAYGHGTHVAGIVAANGSTSEGKIKGIAPGANIIDLRVLDANGAGNDSSVITAIQRAIALKSTYNIRVINLSLGRRVFESYKLDPLCQAVEQAWKAGIVVVAAAGNSGRDNSMGTLGYGTIASPANDPYVITVGATNTRGTPNRSDDVITSYSSKGPTLVDHIVKPDIVAPGNLIASLLAKGSTLDLKFPTDEINPVLYGDSASDPASYFILSGTSMATPMVSGAAALLLQKDPDMSPDQIKARLMKTAGKFYRGHTWSADTSGKQYSIQYDIFTMGAGYLDVNAAVISTELSTGNALSPTATRDLFGNVSITADSTSVWGGSVIWGTSVIWGSSVVWGSDAFLDASSVIWGSSVVWGTSGTSGYSVIWGSSVVWGSSNVDGLDAGDSDQQ